MGFIDTDVILEILERDIEYNKDIPERADGIRDAIIEILNAEEEFTCPLLKKIKEI